MACLSLLPASMGILMAVTIVTAYAIAVFEGDVQAIWPYISDTGTSVPESCLFSQFLNMAAAIGAVTVYLRYRLVLALTFGEDIRIQRLATAGCILALLSCFGLMLVGNFQENEVHEVHFCGAALVFIGGTIYAILDTVTTFRMFPEYNGMYICKVRLAICVASVISFIAGLSGAVISVKQSSGSLAHNRLHWDPNDSGYAAHLVGTFGEWAIAFCYIFYFFTFIRDFQKFRARVEIDIRVVHLDDEPRVVGRGQMPQLPTSREPQPQAQTNERTGLLKA